MTSVERMGGWQWSFPGRMEADELGEVGEVDEVGWGLHNRSLWLSGAI